MQYMLLVYLDPALAPESGSPEEQEAGAAWVRLHQEMGPVVVSGAPLEWTDTATTVRTNGTGEPVLTDGPFAETKEFLGGYYILDVPDLDTATAWAAKFPNQGRGSVEVRPVMPFPTA